MTNEELLAKIKAEIEKLKTFYGELHTDFVCEALLSFLSTFESEKPVSNDLEEAAGKSSTQYYQDAGYSPFPNVETAAHKSGFIAGAKWDREQMISALKNDGDLPIEFIDKFHEIDRNAFQNGQANMKEQMLKEAVEGRVISNDGISFPVSNEIHRLKLMEGDKVRIIVIPNTDKK